MPLPMPAICGVAMMMASRGFLDLARITLVAADCYLLPGEGLSLCASNVLEAQRGLGAAYARVALLPHPSTGARPSKVGLYGDSVVCDSAQW